jgi:hypothetical protein
MAAGISGLAMVQLALAVLLVYVLALPATRCDPAAPVAAFTSAKRLVVATPPPTTEAPEVAPRHFHIGQRAVWADKVRPSLDPLLDCSRLAEAYLNISYLNGYLVNKSQIDEKVPRAMVRHIVKDFGCFTVSSVAAPFLWRAELVKEFPYFGFGVGVEVESGLVVDASSSKLTYTYHGDKSYDDNLRLTELRGTVDALRRDAASLRADATALPNATVLRGDVAYFPLQYWNLLGQVFQESMDYYARYYLSGLLENNATIVVPRSPEAKDVAMVTWIEEYIPAKIVVAEFGRTYYSERSHFVTPLMKEAVAPCTTLFVHEYLLPRVRARLRRDPRFQWGNETIRNDTAASDAEWAATLPKKIMIIKQNKHGAHQRAFKVGERARSLMANASFVNVPDNLPFAHRLLLINSADVMLTTFGSLLTMMMRLWGGWDRAATPLRVIVLMHNGYKTEKEWAWPFPCRVGQQRDRHQVIVTSESTFSAANTWTKTIVMAEDLDNWLHKEHLAFEPAHCTLRFPNGTVPDFPSEWMARGPLTQNYFRLADHPGRRNVPRYGACLEERYGPLRPPPRVPRYGAVESAEDGAPEQPARQPRDAARKGDARVLDKLEGAPHVAAPRALQLRGLGGGHRGA